MRGPPPLSDPQARRLVFHVGDFKTGSTSIQAALHRGLVTSPGQRLLYPGHIDHRPLAKTLADDADPGEYAARWIELSDRLGAGPWDRAVVSSEQFEFYPPERLAEAIATHLAPYRDEIRVVLYLRPHADRILSTWSEHLKQGFTTDPLEAKYDELLRSGRLLYAARVARWRAVFGPALVVRPMLRAALHRGDVVADFLRLALDREDAAVAPLAEENRRLSMPDLSLMREMHLALRARDPGLAGAGHAFAWQFARFLGEVAPAGDAPRAAIHADLARRMRADYGADAARLDREVFGGALFAPALERAAARAVPEPQPVAAGAWHAPETIRLVRVWAAMLAHVLPQDARPLLQALEPYHAPPAPPPVPVPPLWRRGARALRRRLRR